jgi:hypothetical protein
METGLCKYKDMFGKPGEGLHAYRLGGVAIVDVVMTLVAAYLLARWRGWGVLPTTAGLFLAGVIAHRVFCVRTAVDVKLREAGI